MALFCSFLWLSTNALENRRKVTDVENKLMVTREECREQRRDTFKKWETGIDIHALLYIKQMTNKDLLYSTGKSAQSSVVSYMGKEYKKRVDICIYITEALCCTAESNVMF